MDNTARKLIENPKTEIRSERTRMGYNVRRGLVAILYGVAFLLTVGAAEGYASGEPMAWWAVSAAVASYIIGKIIWGKN